MTAPCIHYWILDKYNLGTCKLCGVAKQCGPDPRETAEAPRWGHKAGRFVEMDKPTEETATVPVDGKAKLAAALDMVKANPEMSVTQIALKHGIPASTLAYQVKIKELRPRLPVKTKHKVRRRPIHAKERNKIIAYLKQNPGETLFSVAESFNRGKTAIVSICKQAGIERKKGPRGPAHIPPTNSRAEEPTDWFIEQTEKRLRAAQEEIAELAPRLAGLNEYATALLIVLEGCKKARAT